MKGPAFGCWFPHPILELTPAPEMQRDFGRRSIVCSSCYLERCAQGSFLYAFGLAYVRGPASKRLRIARSKQRLSSNQESFRASNLKRNKTQKIVAACRVLWEYLEQGWLTWASWLICKCLVEPVHTCVRKKVLFSPEGNSMQFGGGGMCSPYFPAPVLPQVVLQKFSSKTVTLKRDFNSLPLKKSSKSFKVHFNKSDATPSPDLKKKDLPVLSLPVPINSLHHSVRDGKKNWIERHTWFST